MKEGSTHNRRRRAGDYPVNLKNAENAQSQLPAKVDLRSVVFYRDLHRFISRYWKPHISAAEFSILDMIFDRTIGWGKLWERISLNQFVHGVWNHQNVYSDGTGLGKRTIQRAIKTLLDAGLIKERATHGFPSNYAINLFWEPPKLKYRNGKTPFSPNGSASYWVACSPKVEPGAMRDGGA